MRSLIRLLLPFFASQILQKAEKNMRNQYNKRSHNAHSYHNKNEIEVDYMPPTYKKQRRTKEDEGEFIDFEEIKK